MPDPNAPTELSVFLTTPAGKDPTRAYRDALDSIILADQLGYRYAWIAEAHFNTLIGVPSALTLLAAASQVSDRIRLGTAVVPLAFDNPLRLAETAALVNALSGDRLEFGVGKGNPKGFSTDAYRAFGLDEDDRSALFARALGAVKSALGGPVQAGGKQVALYPPGESLLDRIWQATGDRATAAAAGRNGDGLLLFRTTPGGPAGQLQAPLVDSYLEAFDSVHASPRIGVSRSILLAGSRREAIEIATADFEERDTDHPQRPESSQPRAVEEYLLESDIAFGSVEDVVDALSADVTVSRSTNYLFNFPFAPAGSPALRESLELVAGEVYPRLQPIPISAQRDAVVVGAGS